MIAANSVHELRTPDGALVATVVALALVSMFLLVASCWAV